MLRSIGAVMAGFAAAYLALRITFAIMKDGVTTTPGSIMLLGAAFLAMMLGGYVSASVAARNGKAHAIALGVLIAIQGLIGLSLPTANGEPLWVKLGFIVVAVGAVVGGKLQERKG